MVLHSHLFESSPAFARVNASHWGDNMNAGKRGIVIALPLERSQQRPPRGRTVLVRDGKFVLATAPATFVDIEEAVERTSRHLVRRELQL
jgi:hypothetical protein